MTSVNPLLTGAQNSMRYAFFPKAHRLLIEQDGKLSTYDSGDHQIGGVQQSGGLPSFTVKMAQRLDELKKV